MWPPSFGRFPRDRLRQLAAIKALAACLGDLLQRRGMIGRAKMLARLRRASMRQERLGKAGLRVQPLDLVAQIIATVGDTRNPSLA